MSSKYILNSNRGLQNHKKGLNKGKNPLQIEEILLEKGGLKNIHKQIVEFPTDFSLAIANKDEIDDISYSDINVGVSQNEIFANSMEKWLNENYNVKLQDVAKHKDLYKQFLKEYKNKTSGKQMRNEALFTVLKKYFPYDYK